MKSGWVALALFVSPASAQDGLGGMLPKMPPPPASLVDPIAAATDGLIAEIEDDNGGGSFLLVKSETADCITRFIGATRIISFDWRKTNSVAPGDTFVFFSSVDVQFAVVGDASKIEQAQKLGSLLAASFAMIERCPKSDDPAESVTDRP
jgi:hypothetical protein